VTKSIGLIFALAWLHNFCLDDRGRRPGEAPVATDPLLDIDQEHMMNYMTMDILKWNTAMSTTLPCLLL